MLKRQTSQVSKRSTKACGLLTVFLMGLLSTGAYAAVDEYPIAVELVSSGDGWVAKSSFTLPSCDERLVSGAFLLMYAVGEAEEGIRSFDVEAMVSLDSNLESLIGQVPEIQFTSRPLPRTAARVLSTFSLAEVCQVLIPTSRHRLTNASMRSGVK